jgi:hypothetical protein
MVQISLFHLMPYAHLDAAPRRRPLAGEGAGGASPASRLTIVRDSAPNVAITMPTAWAGPYQHSGGLAGRAGGRGLAPTLTVPRAACTIAA